MFQPLMKQVTELTIDTEERLKGVIDLIFEKAISEPNFSVAYANMCRCLMGVSVWSEWLCLCTSDDRNTVMCVWPVQWSQKPILHQSWCVLSLSLQLKVPTTDKPGVSVNFRKLLLNRCQKEFEKDKDDDETFEKKQKELDAAAGVWTKNRMAILTAVWNMIWAAIIMFYSRKTVCESFKNFFHIACKLHNCIHCY